MAISLKHKSVTIDVNNRNAPNVVGIVNVNDKATRYLDVTLTASGEKLTFADCTVTATFATDGYLISDSVACTLNSTADLITVPLENFNSTSGFLAIEIKIANGETQVLNTPLTLKVMVTPSLAENSKINSESIGSFVGISREIATARGSYDNLDQRLNDLIVDDEGVITTFNLADGAVTTAIIEDGAVTKAKLSSNLNTLAGYGITDAYTKNDVDAKLAKKADKATTLDGYGITDAYTQSQIKTKLEQKLNKMPFDSEPTLNSPCYLTSGTVYNALLVKADKTALATKYDSSNVEVGKGELTPAQAIYDGCKGSFNYSKIGKTVTVALNITNLVAGKNYVQLAGLPFMAMTASRLSSIAVYTTANKLVNIRLDGSWLYINSPGTTFAEGEKINSIITYIIN